MFSFLYIWGLLYLTTCHECHVRAHEKCHRVFRPKGSPLSLLGESRKTHESHWIIPGEDFQKLEIRLFVKEKDSLFSLMGSCTVNNPLVITPEKLFTPKELNGTYPGMRLNVKVFEKERVTRDHLVLRAILHSKVFEIDEGLWWKICSFKKYQIYAQGEITFYKGCNPFITTRVSSVNSSVDTAYYNSKLDLMEGEKIYSLVTISFVLVALLLVLVIVGTAYFVYRKLQKHQEGEKLGQEEENHYCSISEMGYDNIHQNRRLSLPPPLPPPLFNPNLSDGAEKSMSYGSTGVPYQTGRQDDNFSSSEQKKFPCSSSAPAESKSEYIDMSKGRF